MADAAVNIKKIGFLNFPLRSIAGEDVYGKIGTDGQGNYYEWNPGMEDGDNPEWQIITDDDDIERIKSGGLKSSTSPNAPVVTITDPEETSPSNNTALLTPALAAAGPGSLRYPSNVSVKGDSHYVLFNFKKYKAPFSKEAQSNAGANATPLTGYNANTNNLEPSGLAQVLLYMPEGVAASYKANWDGKAFGNIAAGVMRAGGQAMKNDYAQAIAKIASTSKSALDKAPEMLASQAISKLTKKLTGDSIGIQDVFSSIGGAILNPNVELIFGGQELRTLQLTFKMVPYNKTEAIAVHKIVEVFKKAMLPTLNQADTGDFWGALQGQSPSPGAYNNAASSKGTRPENIYGTGFIGVPNLVQISFMRGGTENKRVTKYKVCSITDFDVNYSPDGVYAVGPDGYPVATEIRVNFMETKLVYKEDVASGF